MGAKFLCCLPLRLGVLVISLIQFLVCGGVAGLLWWALCSNQNNDGNAQNLYENTRSFIPFL